MLIISGSYFCHELFLTLVDDFVPQTGVLKTYCWYILLVFFVELNSTAFKNLVAVAFDDFLPVPAIDELVNQFLGK